MSVYLGKKQKIKDHLKLCYELDKQIFDNTRIGMKLSDNARFAHKLYQEHGLTNNIASPTDPTGTNVGHTIPVSYEDWSHDELNILKNGDKNWLAVCNMISKKRKFENMQETLQIKPGMAFTIEPRPQVLNDQSIPMVFFHTIALFHEDGSKEHLTQFDEIFKLTNMDYLL